ncbi:DUF397 domain-containing protein [Streptomyces sp. NPDC057474]|uniref:DUF397 domain-containing protein n=1 Tax=Streptomyces sp. NPDC057474 TaxID=3346144 RepID=UPI00369CAFC5
MSELNWQKSSFSGGPESSCLYIATAPDRTIRLRESDTPDVILGTDTRGLSRLLLHIKSETDRR